MFSARSNIQTLWDVLQDEQLSNMNQESFLNNINLFRDREKSSGLTLFQMNTKFIMQFKDFLDKQKTQQQRPPPLIQQQYKQDGPIRLNIHDNEPKYSITAEELHAERIGDFEKQLSQKQNEFSSLMIQEKPPDLNFSDVKDSPIGSEMEQLIASTLKQRNFDIEQIQNANTNNDSSWLTSTETSLKSEKINSGPPIKSDPSITKHITWSNELTTEEPIERKDNIFSKLKQIKDPLLIEINDKLDKIIKHLNII